MSGLWLAFVYIGSILIILGAAVFLINKIPYLGKLPGDIFIKRKKYTIYIPLTSMLSLSLVVSVVLNFFRK